MEGFSSSPWAPSFAGWGFADLTQRRVSDRELYQMATPTLLGRNAMESKAQRSQRDAELGFWVLGSGFLGSAWLQMHGWLFSNAPSTRNKTRAAGAFDRRSRHGDDEKAAKGKAGGRRRAELASDSEPNFVLARGLLAVGPGLRQPAAAFRETACCQRRWMEQFIRAENPENSALTEANAVRSRQAASPKATPGRSIPTSPWTGPALF